MHVACPSGHFHKYHPLPYFYWSIDLESTTSSAGIKRQLVMIGLGTAAAAVTLALTIISFGGDTFSLADIQFLFLNQQEVTIEGKFVECVPTKRVQPCYMGFQSNDGAYFVFTGQFDKVEILRLIDQGQFQVTGKFTSSTLEPEEFQILDVVGGIKLTSIIPVL
jgi:hypothetical protein